MIFAKAHSTLAWLNIPVENFFAAVAAWMKTKQQQTNMEITVKQLIEKELFRVCKQVTSKFRDAVDKNENRKYSNDEVLGITQALKDSGYSGDTLQLMLNVFAKLMKAPELGRSTMIPTEPFCVLVLSEGHGKRHNYKLEFPLIVTSNGPHLLDPANGKINQWVVCPLDRPRYATDEEIKAMVFGLCAYEWEAIYKQECFRPILEGAFGRIVSIKEEPVNELNKGSEDGEVELPDGRKITVDTN